MTVKRIKRKIDKLLAGSVLKLAKRPRFVLSTLLLTIALILTQILPPNQNFSTVVGLAIFSYLLAMWCLWEELSGIEYLTLAIPPVLYTISVSLFYYLLPLRWITRVPVALLYAIGFYAIILSENIYNVAAIRTIALLRAAKAVSLLFVLITGFFLFNTLFSFHLNSLANFIIIFSLVFLISLSEFWTENLTLYLERRILLLSLSASLVMAEVVFVISFWPIKGTFASLYLVSLLYTTLSIIENKIKEMPLKNSLWEYAVLNILAVLMLIRMSNWKI